MHNVILFAVFFFFLKASLTGLGGGGVCQYTMRVKFRDVAFNVHQSLSVQCAKAASRANAILEVLT